MKNLRLVAFLVFAGCAFSLPTIAQTNNNSKPKQWTYKADNAGEVLTIIITQGPNGYEVTGDFKAGGVSLCKLRGSYLPAGRRFRANCVYSNGEKWEVNGSKLSGKDAFQVEVGSRGLFVAKPLGAKPATTGSSTESSASSDAGAGLEGCWKWTWQLKTAKGRQDEAVLKLSAGGGASIPKIGLSGTWKCNGASCLIDWGRGAGKEDKMSLSGDKLSGSNFETNWIKGEKIPCN